MAASRFVSSAPSRWQCWWMNEERERMGLGERNEGFGKSIGTERERGEREKGRSVFFYLKCEWSHARVDVY